MIKKGGIYIIIAVITIGLIMFLEYSKPKKLNWFPSYVTHHKIPYGTYVLNDLMNEMFVNKTKPTFNSPYEFLQRNDSLKGTYFFVNETVSYGEAELHTLLDWTSKGNTLFIASESFEEELLDTLHLETATLYDATELQPTFLHQLAHPKLKLKKPIAYTKEYNTTYFSVIDTLNTVALGWTTAASDSTKTITKAINSIKQQFGKGTIILSTFPKAFTNYFILKDNNKNLTSGLLSYLDDTNTIIIDNHYKRGKSFYTSPMHIFLNTKELKWAYYIAFIGVLFYVVFEGKRKQRAIPIVKPLTNQTVTFTRTIADMYFEKGEQKPIIEHKINHFYDYLRSRFHISTYKINTEFYKNLGARSNHSEEEVKKLFTYLNQILNKTLVTDLELTQLNKKIEKFKTKADGK